MEAPKTDGRTKSSAKNLEKAREARAIKAAERKAEKAKSTLDAMNQRLQEAKQKVAARQPMETIPEPAEPSAPESDGDEELQLIPVKLKRTNTRKPKPKVEEPESESESEEEKAPPKRTRARREKKEIVSDDDEFQEESPKPRRGRAPAKRRPTKEERQQITVEQVGAMISDAVSNTRASVAKAPAKAVATARFSMLRVS